MKVFGIILGAVGTIFIFAVNWIFGFCLIILAIILLLIPTPSYGSEKKCPQCAEMVKKEAQICRFCNHKFAEEKQKIENKISEKQRIGGNMSWF